MKKRTRKLRRAAAPDASTLHPIKLAPIAMVEAPMPATSPDLPSCVHDEQCCPKAPKQSKIARWLGIIFGA